MITLNLMDFRQYKRIVMFLSDIVIIFSWERFDYKGGE